jgi:2-polyprenyl-6-methoxyphenol hydroxylase-like FAD-dependent oxidoreductase
VQDHTSVDVEKRSITFSALGVPRTYQYDLLVGAEGPRSLIRKVILKNDRSMKSQLSFVGPLRYVTAKRLSMSDIGHADEQWKTLFAPPLESFRNNMSVDTKGAYHRIY